MGSLYDGSHGSVALSVLALLSLQFSLQPILAQAFVHPQAVKTAVVLQTELLKAALAAICLLIFHSKQERTDIFRRWTARSCAKAALFPAILYALQNWLVQLAYQHLDSVVFNLLNQTKILFAAVCCYIVIGKRQSAMQILALCILVTAGFIVNLRQTSNHEDSMSQYSFQLGVIPVLIASFLSGFSSALVELTSKYHKRSSFLLSLELAFFSTLALIGSAVFGPDKVVIRSRGFFHQWRWHTWIPVFTQASGGIIVGLVMKYAGSDKKGFALIIGLILTGIFQAAFQGKPLRYTHYVASVLVSISMFLHSRFPYKKASEPAKKTKTT